MDGGVDKDMVVKVGLEVEGKKVKSLDWWRVRPHGPLRRVQPCLSARRVEHSDLATKENVNKKKNERDNKKTY